MEVWGIFTLSSLDNLVFDEEQIFCKGVFRMYEESSGGNFQRKTAIIVAGALCLALLLVIVSLFTIFHQRDKAAAIEDPTDFEVTLGGRIAAEGEDPPAWQSKQLKVHPGDQLEVQVGYINLAAQTQANVCLGFDLPDGITYSPGSAQLFNVNSPNGETPVEDMVVDYGANIGNYAGYTEVTQPEDAAEDTAKYGASGYVRIQLTIPEDTTEITKPIVVWVRAGTDGEEAHLVFQEITLNLSK